MWGYSAPGPSMLWAMGEAHQKLEALSDLNGAAVAAARADIELREAVRVARAAGATWSDIGGTLGVKKQTAWEKYWRDCDPLYHTA